MAEKYVFDYKSGDSIHLSNMSELCNKPTYPKKTTFSTVAIYMLFDSRH